MTSQKIKKGKNSVIQDGHILMTHEGFKSQCAIAEQLKVKGFSGLTFDFWLASSDEG